LSRPAVFLDRDGTIIIDKGYLCRPEEVAFEHGAIDGLRAISSLGLPIVVVSNQSGVARGYFSSEHVDAVNRRISQLLHLQEVDILAWYFCPHGDGDACDCRKPAPGMLVNAARQHDLDLLRSFVVGDKRCDLELATAIQATGILVKTGKGSATAAWAKLAGIRVCANLPEVSVAIRALVRNDRRDERRPH